jgi:hypothetical protein
MPFRGGRRRSQQSKTLLFRASAATAVRPQSLGYLSKGKEDLDALEGYRDIVVFLRAIDEPQFL